MKKIILYMHGGSLNRGCEAIVRSTCEIIHTINDNVTLVSHHPTEDLDSGIDSLCAIMGNRKSIIERISFTRVIASVSARLFGSFYYYYQDLVSKSDSETIALSIGGDNYCYPRGPETLASLNKMLKNRKAITVLWGCSIDPDIMGTDVIEDLKKYDLITPRESITYDALMEKGVNKNTQLFPDPAFRLNKIDIPLPSGFVENNTVGLNMSPVIMKLENNDNIAYENYYSLVEYIINTTDMQIALIPHVTWENNSDMVPLTTLYSHFKKTGRVILLGDQYNCMELKGFISRCRMFVGARTHATIAAYATGVPTLVVGYSVKARGIARDLFGSEENMVISVQSLKQQQDLVNAFKYIQENENTIRKHLQEIIPSYIEKAGQAGEELQKLIEDKKGMPT